MLCRHDDRTRSQKEQRFEDGMVDQMGHPCSQRPYPQTDKSDGKVRHRRIGKHFLHLILYQGTGRTDEGTQCAHCCNDKQRFCRHIEVKEPCHDVDTTVDHRGTVDQGRDRRRPLHCTHQPRKERELPRLSDRSDKDEHRNDEHHVFIKFTCGRECIELDHIECTCEVKEQSDRCKEEDIPKAGKEKGSDTRICRVSFLVPERDQQVACQPHELPSDKKSHHILGAHQQDHPSDEEKHLRIVARLMGIFIHIVMGEMDIEQPQSRRDQQHHQRKFVDIDTERNGKRAHFEPCHRNIDRVFIADQEQQCHKEKHHTGQLCGPECQSTFLKSCHIGNDSTDHRKQKQHPYQGIRIDHVHDSSSRSISSGITAPVILFVAAKIRIPAAASSVARIITI